MDTGTYTSLLGWIDEVYPEICVYVLDKSYRYQYFNPEHANLMRRVWAKEIELEKPIFSFTNNKEITDKVELAYERVLRGEAVVEVDEYPIHGEEGLIERKKFYRPLYGEQNGIVGVVGIVVIALERTSDHGLKMEKELLRNEKLMRETNALAKIGGWEVDLASNEPYFTSGTFDIYDIDDQTVPRPHEGLSFYPPHDRKILIEAIDEVIQNHGMYDLEVDFISKKGVEKKVRTLGKVDVEDGKPIRLYGAIQDVTELKKVEQSVLESTKRFEAIYLGTPLPMSMITLEGEILGFNPAFKNIIGYTVKEIPTIGKWYELGYKNDETIAIAEGNWEQIKADAAAGATKFEPIVRDVVCKNGETRRMELHFSLVTDFLVVVFIDITDKVAAESALVFSEKLYRDLYNLAPVMIDSLNKEAKIVHVNDFWLYKLGYSREEVLGREIFDFIHKKDIRASRLAFNRFVVTHEIDNFRFRFIKKNGDSMDTLVNAIAQFDSQDRFYNTISVYQDITQRAKAEKDLIGANKRISNLINNIPGVVFRAKNNAKRQLEFVSANGKNMFGVTMKSIQTSEVNMTDFIQEEDREHVEQQIRNELAEFQSYNVIYKTNIDIAGKKWIQESGTLTNTKDGDSRIEGSIFDITDRVLTQERLTATTMETEDRERTRISKEIHDGLQQTLGLSSLIFDKLRQSDSLSDDDRKVLEDGLNHLDSAMNECRDIAHRLMPVSITDFGLVNAVENLVTDFNKSGSLHVNFINNFDESTRLKKTTETSLFRIIQEAFTNIQKHSNAKNCSLQLLKIDEYIQLTIEDDGVGFEHSLDFDDHAKLGLKNMQNRASSMAGELLVESQKEGGTLIICRIPLGRNV